MIDVIAITETKLKSNNFNDINIEGYNFVNVNSSSNAGGVALFINDRFKFTVLLELSTANDLCETAFIEVTTKIYKKGVRKKNKAAVNLKTGRFDNINSAVIISSVCKAVQNCKN